ncbi:MAG: hypothetical protein ABSH36_09555, partial [Solirubrobacteraceae bacterium]
MNAARTLLLATLCVTAGALTLSNAPALAFGACPNEQLRAEQPFGLNLPDCRAYEMVSPLETNGNDATDSFTEDASRASVSGDAITFDSRGSFADPTGSDYENQFLSRRGSSGWSTQSITPPYKAYASEGFYDPYSGLVFTPELSTGVARTDVPLATEAPAGLDELYAADFASGSYQWLSTPPTGEEPFLEGYGPALMGASTDLSHVLFAHEDSLYEWVDGEVSLVGVANSGEGMNAVAGSYVENENPGGLGFHLKDAWYAISSDGSRVFFTSPGLAGQLYVRENAERAQSPLSGEECTDSSDACTIEVSASQKTSGSGPKGADLNQGEARYWGASADGSKVFFTSDQELTNDANTGVSDRQEVLFENATGGTYTLTLRGQTTAPISYPAAPVELQSALEGLPSIGAGNVAVSAAGGSGDTVTFEGDLAGVEQPPLTADGSFLTKGGSVGVRVLARPGSDLYEYNLESGRLADLTVDTSDVAEGAAVQGVVQISEDGSYVYFVANGVLTTEKSALGAQAEAGKPNLYVSHKGGAPTFIATLAPGNNQTEAGDSPDWGRAQTLAGPATNTAAVSPDGARLAFLSERSLTGYDNELAENGVGTCEDTNGNAAKHNNKCREVYLYDAETGGLVCASCDASGGRPVGPSSLNPGASPYEYSYRPRNFSEAGVLFFDSYDALVPHASDGRENVYEFEDGHVYPISDVAGGYESFFLDASASGDDVFFGTADQLLPEDRESNVVVWDARVDGGFPVSVS